jgi:hypothetical protein
MALIAGVNEGKQLPASLPASLVQLVWPAGFPGQAVAAPVDHLIGSGAGVASSGSTLLYCVVYLRH